jgi:hypothetical protein
MSAASGGEDAGEHLCKFAVAALQCFRPFLLGLGVADLAFLVDRIIRNNPITSTDGLNHHARIRASNG